MEEIEVGSVYSWTKMEKQAIGKDSEQAIHKSLVSIGSWFSSDMTVKYYMLLSNEKRDYTIFNFISNNYVKAIKELQEVIDYRGSIYSIDYNHEHNYYEIWIEDYGHELNVYLLFPCDDFIVEI